MAFDYKSLGLKCGLEIHQHGSFSFFAKERNAPRHLKKEKVRSAIARAA